MILIENKEDCVGCGACEQRCPVSCITLNKDSQGFGYAKADPDRCIECGLCERVCPVLHPGPAREPVRVSGCYNTDSGIVDRASSGGTFEQLVKSVIADGGVVFGASFTPDWSVAHTYAESLDGCRKFARSKYMQSEIGTAYKDAEKFLKEGRKVLFSGTPCQISGLRLFLGKEYDNLLKVEVACHGVPSPLVWHNYLTSVAKGKKVVYVDFRDKRIGWEDYRVVVKVADGKNAEKEVVCDSVPQNIFMRGFLRDLYLRPSCFACPAKKGRSGADVTLADFWGIRSVCPDFYNHKGVSLVLDYGNNLPSEGMITLEVPYNAVIQYNPALIKSAVKPEGNEIFWQYFEREGIAAVGRILPEFRQKGFLNRLFSKVFHKKI